MTTYWDGDQHQENHGADDVVTAHHEASEGLDHMARGRDSRVAVRRIRRAEEMSAPGGTWSAGAALVGNTLKSTAFRIYTETSSTMTESVISTTIRKSSSIDGMGMMSATTIATTAIGTASRSTRWVNRQRQKFGLGCYGCC